MNREQIFQTLKDLIKALRTSNIKEPEVLKRWNSKRIEVEESVQMLSKVDQRWLEDQYEQWIKKEDLEFFSWNDSKSMVEYKKQ
jgi:predicted transcriptional regulator